MKTADRARGKWRGILIALGVDQRFLSSKHGPCPFCEGRDRFRWDNKGANGSFICSQCGAGDGIEFVKRFKGWTFNEAAREIDKVCGHVADEPQQVRRIDPRARADMLNRLWASAKPLTAGDMAGRYLAKRGVLPLALPSCLRFAAECPIPFGGGMGPAMIALVMGPEGDAVNIHRTFLGPNGKADMENPRALMPGEFPDGSAVRLAPAGDVLGIAEGIETALAASLKFGLPVWAAINAGSLAKWTPPPGVSEVVIFGDHDESFTGQAAAYTLANRLKARLRINARVMIPDTVGKDWADAA
jgi:putative DNA primase/helicase